MSESGDLDRQRIDQLEQRVAQLEADLRALQPSVSAPPAPTAPPPPVGPTPPAASPVPPPPPPREHSGRPTPSRPGRWMEVGSEAVLRWAGVALVVMAVGFAVSTAISRGWIGPGLQLLGAVALSAALVAGGWRLRPTRMPWAHALCAGGLLALVSTVASSLFVDRFDEPIALGGTAAIAVSGYGLARLVPSSWVAASAFLGPLVAWLTISDADTGFLTTLTFIAGSAGLCLAVTTERLWPGVRLLASVVGAFAGLILAAVADGTTEQTAVIVAAAMLFVTFLRLPSLGDHQSFWREAEVQFAMVAAPWSFVVVASAWEVQGETRVGGLAVAAAVVTAVAGFALRSINLEAHLVSLLVGAGVALSIGGALLLDSTAVQLALAVQAAGLVVLAHRLRYPLRVWIQAAVVATIALVWVGSDTLDAWQTDAPLADDLVRALTLAALLTACWLVRDRAILATAAVGATVMSLAWLGSVLVHLPQGQAWVSISWAVVGVAILVVGATRAESAVAGFGLAVLGLTVAKLLTVDLREVDALWRAGLFFLVGIGIMRLGFMLPKLGRGA